MENELFGTGLGTVALLFSAMHIGLTQLVRQLACSIRIKGRPVKIQDSAAVCLSLLMGLLVGPLFFQGLGPSLGLNHLPPSPLDGALLGFVMAAINSGLINKTNGFLKDSARYQAQAQQDVMPSTQPDSFFPTDIPAPTSDPMPLLSSSLTGNEEPVYMIGGRHSIYSEPRKD